MCVPFIAYDEFHSKACGHCHKDVAKTMLYYLSIQYDSKVCLPKRSIFTIIAKMAKIKPKSYGFYMKDSSGYDSTYIVTFTCNRHVSCDNLL